MLTGAQIAALARVDGYDDEDYDPAWDDDDDLRVPPELADVARPAVPEVWDAGFTHGVPGGCGAGFESGGAVDAMLPGRHLAGFTADARIAGLGRLSDEALIGFLCAARRNVSWQQSLELAAVAELDARRSGPGGAPGEHVGQEVAAALRLTRRAAEDLLAVSEGVQRLAQVPAALAAGLLDKDRAAIFARELLPLDDRQAVQAEAMVMPRAAQMTTGQLAYALQHAVQKVDPQAAARRKKQAEKQGRVEAWSEPGRGTGALAGRDLPTSEVMAADKRLTAAARWLRAHGVKAGTDFLRSRAFVAFNLGISLDDLLAGLLTTHDTDSQQGHNDAWDSGEQDRGEQPGQGQDGDGGQDGQDSDGTGQPGQGGDGTGQPGQGGDGGEDGRRGGGREPGQPAIGGPGGSPVPTGLRNPAAPAGLAGLTGRVNLVTTVTTWLGLADVPGEITGSPAGGAAGAQTCRDLAAALAANPATKWCLTITDQHGRAIAHGCATKGPGPPGGGPPESLGWLRSIRLTRLDEDPCSHELEESGYRPSARLRHLIAIRDRRCTAPWCRRPAEASDHDHTIAWQPDGQGGRTCPCNIGPACRGDHRCKQAPGWTLTQPVPGTFIWTAPSGRSYTTRAEPYPV